MSIPTIPPRLTRVGWNRAAVILNENQWEKGVSFIVRVKASHYEAINGGTGKVSYGGSGNIGGATGTDFEAVFKACVASNTSIYLASGTYNLTSQGGIWLAQATGYSDIVNFSVIAPAGAKWLYTCTGTPSPTSSLFYISDGWKNILFEGITFDMNMVKSGKMPVYPDTSDTGVQWTSMGDSWIIGVTTHAGQNKTEYVTFRKCQFLHGPDCGLNLAACSHVYFENCFFNGFGEHPVYSTENSVGDYCLDLQFKSCTFLNFAKAWRGNGIKNTFSDGTIVDGCYFDPNEDAQGFGPDRIDGHGPYGIVTGYCNNTWIKDSTFIGQHSVIGGYRYGYAIENSENTVIENIAMIDWNGVNHHASSTNTKLIGGKFVDTPFTYPPTIATNVQIVTAGVTSYYSHSSGGSSVNVTIVPINIATGYEDSVSYPSGTAFSNELFVAPSTPAVNLDSTSGTLAAIIYIGIVKSDAQLRVEVTNSKGFYYDGSYHNQANPALFTILFSSTVGSSITVMAKGDGNWYVTSLVGIWVINV